MSSPSPSRPIRVAAVQFSPTYGERDANLERLATLFGDEAAPRVDVAVLPELATTGYTFGSRAEARRLAEPADGPTTRALTDIARERELTVVVGFAERDGDRVYNSAAVVGPSGLIGVYRKVHLFGHESEWFDVGDVGFPVFDIGTARIGVMVCFDWFFPESMRSLALGGAEVVAHPANLVLPWCQRSMPVRCLENHVVAVTANREGREAREGFDYTFTGGSLVCGYRGDVLARAHAPGEQWVTSTIHPREAADRRLGPIADVFDVRRPGAYRAAPSIEAGR